MKGKRWWLLGGVGIFGALLAATWYTIFFNPNPRYVKAMFTATELGPSLRHHVHELCVTIGERNMSKPTKLEAAALYIEQELRKNEYHVTVQAFDAAGQVVKNIEAERRGTLKASEIVVIGAHYDTVDGTAGANDNGSGVAALLTLAEKLKSFQPERTLRLVAFVNEEPGSFQSDIMGSVVYARKCRAKSDNIVAMMSLETIGYYSDAAGSQKYPVAALNAVYGDKGNFIAFVGNIDSSSLVKEVVGAFKKCSHFPAQGSALPESVPGAGWSDHWSFWQEGYPALMATDTAPFRYPYYHHQEDTPDKIVWDKFAEVVAGLGGVVQQLTKSQP